MSTNEAVDIACPPFPGLTPGQGEDYPASPSAGDTSPLSTPSSPPENPPPPDIAPPPHSSSVQPTLKENASFTASPLSRIPSDISTHRNLLFALDTPVQLTPAVWDRFWPYIDNVWCVHQKPQPSPSTGIAKVYGACRLNRKTNFPLPEIHEHSRPRQRREGGTCKAKFRLTIYPDGRRVVERTGEGHSHTLEHIDSVKRNSGVRSLILDDFFKSWEAGGILAFLRDTSAAAGPTNDLLRDAGGLYLSRQEVQNILNGALKKAYPGQDISEVKKQMDKYKNYTTCNYKGCSAPAFPDIKTLMDHRKSVHGLKSHDHSDKLYACPDKACWRRKKSKGFTTLLGLEEHIRDKHSSGFQSMIATEADFTDPLLTDQLSTMPNMPLANLNLNLGINTTMMNSLASLLPDPITPDSSSEDQQKELHIQDQEMQLETGEVEAEVATRVLTKMERENMIVRIKRLQIERTKLDQEIRRLNKAVWGDEKGQHGGGEGGEVG